MTTIPNNQTQTVAAVCPSCGQSNIASFFELTNIPVNSCFMVDTRAEALGFPKDNLRLGFCRSCGFIFNELFDIERLRYSSAYEETQGFSPRFNAFAQELAQSWIDRYDLHNKQVLEIGCGKGEFLGLICDLGNNRGIGIDPAYVPGRLKPETEARIDFITEFYSDKYGHLQGDAIICRHTLEHIQPVHQFLETVRAGIGDRRDTIVLFELPDVGRVLRETAFWDVYYEHCSYFSPGSLTRLFRRCGFDVLDLYKGFDDQYLLIEARPSKQVHEGRLAQEETVEQLGTDVAYFEIKARHKLEALRADLDGMVQSGERVVVWGSGSKAVSYLTSLGIRNEIEYVVDINPFKHGKFLAGTGHKIVAPEYLTDYEPDTVILMNSIYRDEVQRDLDRMSLGARLIAV